MLRWAPLQRGFEYLIENSVRYTRRVKALGQVAKDRTRFVIEDSGRAFWKT